MENTPLTLQELVKMDGLPVWAGEPINAWYIVAIDPENPPEVTPDTKVHEGWMMVDGERKDIPVVDMYRYPPDWNLDEMRFHRIKKETE